MKPTDPLTLEEVQSASDTFFPLFEEVKRRMPFQASTEDTLKVMESVCQLAQKLRATEEEENKIGPFGFYKKDETTEDREES